MRVDDLQLRNVVTKRFVSPRLPEHQVEYAGLRGQRLVPGGNGLLRKDPDEDPVYYEKDLKPKKKAKKDDE